MLAALEMEEGGHGLRTEAVSKPEKARKETL